MVFPAILAVDMAGSFRFGDQKRAPNAIIVGFVSRHPEGLCETYGWVQFG